MVFFFKQRTTYELLGSLVGSEMLIRDGARVVHIDIKSGGVTVAGNAGSAEGTGRGPERRGSHHRGEKSNTQMIDTWRAALQSRDHAVTTDARINARVSRALTHIRRCRRTTLSTSSLSPTP